MYSRSSPRVSSRRSFDRGPGDCTFEAADFWRRLAADEEGSAYVLWYVMVLPVVIFIMVLVVETALIMTAKIGVTYAAFAAVRSAAVWQSTAGTAVAEQKARQAAIQALVPFANGLRGSAGAQSGTSPGAEGRYVELYKRQTGCSPRRSVTCGRSMARRGRR